MLPLASAFVVESTLVMEFEPAFSVSIEAIKNPPFLTGMYLFFLIVVEELASEEF